MQCTSASGRCGPRPAPKPPSTLIKPPRSRRSCPKGVDPYPSLAGVDEEQLIDCQCPGVCTGSLRLAFRGHSTRLIPFDASAELVKYRLEVNSTARMPFRGKTTGIRRAMAGSIVLNPRSSRLPLTWGAGTKQALAAEAFVPPPGGCWCFVVRNKIRMPLVLPSRSWIRWIWFRLPLPGPTA